MPAVTLKDVAARAGVSYQTVSKVLNGKAQVAPETEARVWQVVQELNYRPNVSARNLRTQASNLIGCAWYSTSHGAWRPILNSFLYEIIDAAEAHDYMITFFTGGGPQAEKTTPYAELYARRQVEGFILADTAPGDRRIAYLMAQEIPFTAFGQTDDGWDFHWVDVDGRYGIGMVMEHLLGRGHRRIAFITWDDTSQTGVHRWQGYSHGLASAGISPDPGWVYRGSDSAQTGAEGLARFLALPPARRPTAVVCVSDHIAVGAINSAAAAGLQVGRDIAITGYDDVLMAQFLHPPLTTVRQPIQQVGWHVIDLLIKQINQEPVAQKTILLKPELVIRESS